jgi:hypothetical protein
MCVRACVLYILHELVKFGLLITHTHLSGFVFWQSSREAERERERERENVYVCVYIYIYIYIYYCSHAFCMCTAVSQRGRDRTEAARAMWGDRTEEL